MRGLLTAVMVGLALGAAPGCASDASTAAAVARDYFGVIPDLSTCPTLDACMRLIDAAAPKVDNGSVNQARAEAAAAALRRFGEPAKQALLQRAADPRRPGLRNMALGVLLYWPSWSPQDVPALAAALRLGPGGWAATILGRIGDAAAVDVLVEDLQRAGSANQTDGALARIGPSVLPKVLPLLAGDERSKPYEGAASVVRRLEGRALAALPDWIAIAVDPARPEPERMAALGAVAALGGAAAGRTAALRPLRHDPNPRIAARALKALEATNDASLAAEAVAACKPSTSPFGDLPDSSFCLYDLIRFSSAPEIVGPRLAEFARSPNGAEAARALSGLARLAYPPGRALLLEGLASKDWRVVVAAASGLGELGPAAPPEALPRLTELAGHHWSPEVRRRATAAAEAIRAGQPLKRSFDDDQPDRDFTGKVCEAWQWQGEPLRLLPIGQTASLPSGSLGAIDQGEWGGALVWAARGRPQVELIHDNMQTLLPVGDGRILALGGLGHLSFDYGYVVLAEARSDGWRLSEVARLPGRYEQFAEVGTGTWAAVRADRAVVFTLEGVHGMADCVRWAKSAGT